MTEVTAKVAYIISSITTVTESPIMARVSVLASTEFGYPNSLAVLQASCFVSIKTHLLGASAPNTLNKGGI